LINEIGEKLKFKWIVLELVMILIRGIGDYEI